MIALGRRASAHHLLNLSLQAPQTALTLVVTALLSSTATAHFFVAWMIAGLGFVASGALTTALFAAGARDSQLFAPKVRLTMTLSLVLATAASVAVWIGAGRVLDAFGRSYSEQSTQCLRILILASFPLVIKYHYVALGRIANTVPTVAFRIAIAAVFEIGMAAIGAKTGGLTGLSLAWLAAVCIESAFMAKPVLRACLAPEGAYPLQGGTGKRDANRQRAACTSGTSMPTTERE